MGWLLRLRTRVAVWLCRGTGCLVVRERPMTLMLYTVAQLAAYVERSGALTTVQTERRLRAYKVLLRGSYQLVALGREVLLGPFPRLPAPPPPPPTPEEKEESHVQTTASTSSAA